MRLISPVAPPSCSRVHSANCRCHPRSHQNWAQSENTGMVRERVSRQPVLRAEEAEGNGARKTLMGICIPQRSRPRNVQCSPNALRTGLGFRAAPPGQLRAAERRLTGENHVNHLGSAVDGRPLPFGVSPAWSRLAPMQVLTPSPDPEKCWPTYPGDHGTVGHSHQEECDRDSRGTSHGHLG